MEHKEEKNTQLDLDNTLIESTHKVEVFYIKNKKTINTVVLAIVGIVAVYFGFKMFYIEPKEQEAKAAIYHAQFWFEQDSFDLALNGKGDAKPGFLTVAEEYGITTTGNLAHFYAAICYMRKGEFQNAIDQLDDFDSKNELVGPLAIGLKGDAYVELKDIEQGAKLYMKAASMSKNKMTAPIFLKKAGIAYEELKEYSDALRAYEKIKTDYFDSQEARDIDKFIARATAAKGDN